MPPKFITTDGGEEIVLLSRHEYDDLLARLEAAEGAVGRFERRRTDGSPARDDPNAISTANWSIDERLALGHRIAAARKAAGVNRRALVMKAGLKMAELSAIERGLSTCSFVTLARLAEALGLKYDELRG